VIQICLWCVDSGCSKHMTGNLKLLINFIWKFMGTVRFGNDDVAAILGFGKFCDSDLEVAFKRDACFVKNLKGVDLLKGDRSTNLYTINLYEMASASPICLMARAFSTKSWIWHQRLSHLNFDTINDLARNDLVAGLLKFIYHKEHLCPSYGLPTGRHIHQSSSSRSFNYPVRRLGMRSLSPKELARLAKSQAQQDEKANILWDNTQAMIEADSLLAKRLQAREKEEFSEEQKARLLVELIEKRKKHFAALRTQEKRNKPPIKEQIRSQICTYLRNMSGYKHSYLKGRSYDEIKNLFDKEMRKKQKVDENVKPFINDTKELKKCMEIVPDDEDEVLIEATPLSSRSPTIIDYKIHKEGKKTYFKIIRAYSNSQVYQTFEKMFRNFNREDLEVLWGIVKDRFKKEKPVDDMDNLLFRTLKTMFEHHVEDVIWTYQQGLAKVDYDVEMVYDLLRFIRK
nr:integrase, catalytic region, zinc finger, CCHC-type, peptidase aspartic, catalytic [Tanacetum cinerariifolium]